MELHFVELPKLPEAMERNDEPELVAWGKFLAAAAEEEIEALAMEYPVLKQAKEALERLSADPDAQLRAEQREMALLSNALDISVARREGKAEGRAEGKAEALQQLLTLKFGPLPPALAERVRTATEPDVERWTNRVLSAESLANVFV